MDNITNYSDYDLSERAKNILIAIGGIERLKDLYIKNGDFYKIRNVGTKTNTELVQFVINFDQLKTDVDNNSIDENSSYCNLRLLDFVINYDQILNAYFEYKNSLPIKLKLILTDIEDLYYSNNLSSRNKLYYFAQLFQSKIDLNQISVVVNKSDLERIEQVLSRVKFLLKTTIDKSNHEFEIENDQYLIECLLNEFNKLKTKLSVRAINIVDKFFEERVNNNSLFNLFYCLINEWIDFGKFKNCGIKTQVELDNFVIAFNVFVSSLSSKSEIEIKGVLNRQKIESIFNIEIDERYNKFIFYEDGALNVFEILAFVCIEKIIKGDNRLLIDYYCKSEILSIQEIALNNKCSRENVRRITKSFEESLNLLQDDFYLKFQINENCEKLDSIVFCNKKPPISILKTFSDLQINERFYNLINVFYLSNQYSRFIDVVKSITVNKCSMLDLSNCECFFSSSILKRIDFNEFFSWINTELINLKVIDFEPDLKILVNRFVVEKNIIDLDAEKFNSLIKIVSLTVNFETDSPELRKARNLNKRYEVVKICSEYLKLVNKPMVTQDLLDHLNLNFIDISRDNLLKILNNHTSYFTPFGQGYWVISGKSENSNIKGSFRQIVSTLLHERKDPVHISEIMSYLGMVGKQNYRSLYTNLRSDESDSFFFYNCNYVGLKSKRYSQSWFNLPVCRGFHFSESRINEAITKSNGNIEDYFFEKYGYPPQHTRFILSIKSEYVR